MKIYGKIATYLAAFAVIIILNFLLPRFMPGDPLLAIYGEEAALNLNEETKQTLMAEMKLDEPLFIQFGVYLRDLLRGDLGYSYSLNAPVSSVIGGVLPWTLLLAGSSLFLAVIIGFILGVESGWRRGSRLDRIILLIVVSLNSLPNFLLGILFLLLFSVTLDLFPLGGALTAYGGFTGWAYWVDVLKHLCLPMLALALAQLPNIYLLIRAAVLSTFNSSYVQTAVAKGLYPISVRYRHIGRNVLLPLSAELGVALGRTLAGSLFVEIVFSYPGMGSLLHEAIISRDYPLIQGILLIVAVMVISANLLADFLAAKIDPRLRKERPGVG